jgi:hypothetical protein
MFDHQVTFGGGHVYPRSGIENGFFLLFPMSLFICVVTILRETKEEEMRYSPAKPFHRKQCNSRPVLVKSNCVL